MQAVEDKRHPASAGASRARRAGRDGDRPELAIILVVIRMGRCPGRHRNGGDRRVSGHIDMGVSRRTRGARRNTRLGDRTDDEDPVQARLRARAVRRDVDLADHPADIVEAVGAGDMGVRIGAGSGDANHGDVAAGIEPRGITGDHCIGVRPGRGHADVADGAADVCAIGRRAGEDGVGISAARLDRQRIDRAVNIEAVAVLAEDAGRRVAGPPPFRRRSPGC